MQTTEVIHGIEITSRHGEKGEMAQMRNLANALKEEARLGMVVKMFYDSKNCICEFEFKETAPNYQGKYMLDILELAQDHLNQFDWNGTVLHWRPRNKEAE